MRFFVFLNIAILLIGQLAQAQEYRRSINLEWDGIEGAASYDVEIQRIKTEKKYKPRIFNTVFFKLPR